jgi:hypothetical protein
MLQTKIKEAISQHHRYFQSALRDAAAAGLIPKRPDPSARARIISAYIEGLLMHARILNDLSVLREMVAGVLMIAHLNA